MANVSEVMMGLVMTFLGFGILVFVLSLSGSMVSELQSQTCGDLGGTYGSFNKNGGEAMFQMCCDNATNSTTCGDGGNVDGSIAYNVSTDGLEGLETASGFSPLISLAIVIGAIVTILLVFVGGALLGKSRA